MRFETRLRPTQGIPAAAMMNLVLLLVFHLTALSIANEPEPGSISQSVAAQDDTPLHLRLEPSGAIRMGDVLLEDAQLSALVARRAGPGRSVRVEVECAAGLADERLAVIVRALREAGAGEILLAHPGRGEP